MQHKSSLSPSSLDLTLARQQQQKKKRQALIFTFIFEHILRAARAGAALLERVPFFLQVLFLHWILQIVHLVSRFSLYNRQTEEDGLMGGHTRRSKQSAKASSTVLCDFAATLEDWKQQIKVKDSIPANQQRLTFTSQQRTVKQHFALAKLSPNRQWQIVVDASVEDLFKDFRHWRATLRSKNTSAELLQPLVLKETDELASFLHSRTADELREIGEYNCRLKSNLFPSHEEAVPCCVFFLSFNEWIPSLQTKEFSPSNRQSRVLDLKIDEEFRENIFFIDLYGNLNGLPIPVPLKYVMNGSQLATKFFMVEQTAQYREEQKQRYQQHLTPALKDLDAENSEGSLVVNSQSSYSNDYVLEIEQDCEFTAFISRDNHRLRCIVLPVITIPLVETKGSEEHPSVYLPSGDLKEGLRESISNVLALPSTSEVGEASTVTARSIVEEVHPGATPDVSTRKNTKKKRKKKAKQAAKENVSQGTTVEAKSFCLGASMKDSQEDAAADASICLNAENAENAAKNDEVQLLVGNNKSKHGSTAHIKDMKDLAWVEVENKGKSSKQRDFPVHLDEKYQTLASSNRFSNSVSSTRHEHIKEMEMDCASDHNGYCMDTNKEQEFPIDTGKRDETIKVDDASVHKETSPGCNPNTALQDYSNVDGCFGQRVIDPVQPSLEYGFDSGSYSISKLQNEREVHAGSHTRSSQQSFWTQRAAESQDYLPPRTRVNQNSYSGVSPCDSRSSAPFWRHQRGDIPVSSHSWSKPTPSRGDDWSSSRSFPSRQSRNMPAWEQLPNLRQPSNGSTFPMHWENHAPLDRPWSLSSRVQSYSSFNMQQRKFGKMNKSSQNFSDRWQPQNTPNNRAAPNMKFSTTLPSTSSISSNFKEESFSDTQFFSKDFDKVESNNFVQGPSLGMNVEDKVETCESSAREALEPSTRMNTTSSTVKSSQDERCLNAPDKSGLRFPNSQVADHVCDILNAVNASYESWGVYEQVSRLHSKSLCEFERVAKAVAPTFKASMSKQSWKPMDCLCKTIVSKSKNSRQVPDLPLSTLWQWYEEPSSYGLKVKLSESSKRTGSNLQAFFVPYLSAIQLFGWSRKRKTTGSKDSVAAQGGSPFDPNFLSQPIFSILLPRSEIDDEFHTNEVSPKHAGTSHEDPEWVDNGANGRQCHCDVELLYEFFEVEKPQQRKPLTDRINQLVSNSELCRSGDVHVLNSAKIDDLHPSSWFAVAWYPIYKIPDETFRSAFLTYHCLSCLQSTGSGYANTNHFIDSCMNTITAPVVGLMSYNAQVKDWFSLSPSCDVSPDVLQQYLAKLESAATSMARGSCEKSSSFKHADFTFFQSRGR